MSLPHLLPLPERPATAPPRLPALDADAVALRNRVYGLAPCPAGEGRLLVWQAVAGVACSGELHCTGTSGPLRVAADALGALEPRLHGMELLAPSEACTALAEHALAPVLDLLERLTGQSLAVQDFRRPAPPQPADLALGFILTDARGQPDVRGHVAGASALWRSVDPARAPAAPSQRHAAIPLRLSLRLGGCRLPAAELRRVAVGDALRPASRTARPGAGNGLPILALHAGGRIGFRARSAGQDLILDTSMSHFMDTHPTLRAANAPHAAADLDTLVDAVETELVFELGTLQMTLAELSRLRPGQALRLGVRLRDQPVRILTAGRQIARGELATVGDELVVVVTDTGALPLV